MTVTTENLSPILDYDAMANVLASTMGAHGFLFVEDPMVPALSAALRAFVAATGLAVNPSNEDDSDRRALSPLSPVSPPSLNAD
ncbi:hypothetical protein [Actinoplanes derwentensis]|uniref:Uncharacterized protein n=1 Tax=Actinoplanes derwentensis TaxID=113562 RepID=A0A1H2CIL1_9ACTN|nr:hypothetical protein [Actinoplanes derwentensis]GID82564.1 hypothetical protein Ade03nite_14880 [Actinoplanes derwentensis]SDT70380.1 hypothetical protein SAMN04489716_5943 [Actinoplanes derwentensis]